PPSTSPSSTSRPCWPSAFPRTRSSPSSRPARQTARRTAPADARGASSMAERLALYGGTPVRTTPLPYGHQSISETDIAAVAAALRSEWITTGPRVTEFERGVAARVGARHAVAVSSGTAALQVAAFAAGLGPGDEAIVPPLTFAAAANAVRYLGATPVFADVQADTLTLDPERVAEKLTSRTRAIIGVDFAGLPCDWEALRALARPGGLALIDDAAHALGATSNGGAVGRRAGWTPSASTPATPPPAGGGGGGPPAARRRAGRARRFRNHGITVDASERFSRGEWHYEMVDLGFNYRLTDVQCALGLSQITRLDAMLARRRAIATRYRAHLRGQIGRASCRGRVQDTDGGRVCAEACV